MTRKWRVITNHGAFMVYAESAERAKAKIKRSFPDCEIKEARLYRYASPKRPKS